MKSSLVTCSFSALSMSTSTVDVAWKRMDTYTGYTNETANISVGIDSSYKQHPNPTRISELVQKVPSDLDVPVHGGGLSGPDQPLQLCTAVVLRLHRQFGDVDIGSEQVEAPHLVGVDGQDLDAPLLIRQTCGWTMRQRVPGEEGWRETMDMGRDRQEMSVGNGD